MTDLREELLRHAKRDVYGNVALAQLRREDEDVWDTLIVNRDGEPLLFWGLGEQPEKHAIQTEDGATLMVVVATPPGVRPAGLITIPATRSGSPLGNLVSMVNRDGHTVVDPAGDPRRRPPTRFGSDMLDSLLQHVAKHEAGHFVARPIAAADGGKATVLVDWDERVLLFWLPSVADPAVRALYTVVPAPHGDGMIALGVDDRLRPQHSDAGLAALVARGAGVTRFPE